MNCKVSVVIPVYNVEKYLRECINSVLKQTYENIEIILIDDGSTDSSGQICDEFNSNSKVKIVHKKNAGLGFARNSGIEIATGKYIMFLDSDDYIKDDMVEIMLREITNKNADFCKSGFIKINDNRSELFTRNYNYCFFENNDLKNKMFPLMLGSLPDKRDSIEMCATSTLYKLNVILNNNIRFPSERELISEDLIFNMEFVEKAKSGLIIPYCGYYYRTNPNSLTKKYKRDRFESIIYFFKYVENKIIEYGYNDEALLRLKRLFFVYLRMA